MARKRFGQNFLQDQSIINRLLASIAPRPSDSFIEIGPGLGALTMPLLSAVGRLQAIELDRDLIPMLEKQCRELGDLLIHQMDVLQCDITRLAKETMAVDKLRIVGNLPYNISTPLLFHLFKHIEVIADMTFMLQKEVVDRLAAEVGESNYGRLTVMTQYYCQVEKLFIVPPDAFKPAPKVDSAIVHLLPTTRPLLADDINMLEKVSRIAFQQRRKTLRNSLKSLIDAKALEQLNINPGLRPENLTVEDYVRISNKLGKENK
jgi:16S rRNA (adenine1518-N6/adenine1519-N6)-dimethyltransferase